MKSNAYIKLSLLGLLSSIFPITGLLLTDAPLLWPLSVFAITVGTLLMAASFSHRVLRISFIFVVELFIFLLNIPYFFSFYLQNAGFNEAFFYHLQLNIVYGGVGEFSRLIFLSVCHFCVLATIKVRYVLSPPKMKQSWTQKAAVFALVMAGLLLWSPMNSLVTYITSRYQPLAERFNEAGISPNTIRTALEKPEDPWGSRSSGKESAHTNSAMYAARVKAVLDDLKNTPRLSFLPDQKAPNLVFIYLEGIEQRYFDEETFPGLLPNLRALRARSVDFTQVAQMPGTGWTIAGILASQCGYPLYSPFFTTENHQAIGEHFMKGAVCLGDLMKQTGYRMVYMGGADIRFAGKDVFYRSHGYDEIYGSRDLRKKLPDPLYLNEWGLYDDSLFDLAFEKYLDLSQKEGPFVLTLLTLGTHHPDGFLSRSCSEYGHIENPMLDSVLCTDRIVSRFVQDIRESEHSANTVIVVLSDHLALGNRTLSLLKQSGKPRYMTFFVNFPDSRSAALGSKGTHYDITPTVFDLIGFQIEGQFGLGRSLAGQDGYLYSMSESDYSHASAIELASDRAIISHIEGLWHKDPVSLKDRALILNATDYTISFGPERFSFRIQGPQNKAAPTMLEFDRNTLEMEELKAFPFLKNAGKYGLAGNILSENSDGLILAVGTGNDLKGFIERPQENSLAYFLGKPGSQQYRAGLLQEQTVIPPEEIEALAASPESDDVIAMRRKLVETIVFEEKLEQLRLLEEFKRDRRDQRN